MVTDSPLENLDLVLAPSREWSVEVKTDTGSGDLDFEKLRLTLHPRSEMNPSESVRPGGRFGRRAFVAPDETYDLFVDNLPAHAYLKEVRIGNQDRLALGLPGSAADASAPLQVIIGAKAGTVAGRVYTPDGRPATGATVTLVPDSAPSHPQWYRTSSANEYGIFEIGGAAPGAYTAFAYYDEPPCELYDRDALLACRTNGRTVTVPEGSQSVIELVIR